MKFGKNLARVVELSDPEWGPFWINYKFLKKKIKEIVKHEGTQKVDTAKSCDPETISKSAREVAFFRLVRSELRKVSDFFRSAEQQFEIRKGRVKEGYQQLKNGVMSDSKTWTRLLTACVKLYKELLLLENFAIMNFCGFSKILKKHDKFTGYQTRERYMRHVVSEQPFTHYTAVLEMLHEAEQLFADIQRMQASMPLQDEERLFIEAIRSLNYQASRLQAEETGDMNDGSGSSDDGSAKASGTKLSPAHIRDENKLDQRGGQEETKITHLMLEIADHDPNSYSKSARLFPRPRLMPGQASDTARSPAAGLDDAASAAEAAALRAGSRFTTAGMGTVSWMQQVARDASAHEPRFQHTLRIENPSMTAISTPVSPPVLISKGVSTSVGHTVITTAQTLMRADEMLHQVDSSAKRRQAALILDDQTAVLPEQACKRHRTHLEVVTL